MTKTEQVVMRKLCNPWTPLGIKLVNLPGVGQTLLNIFDQLRKDNQLNGSQS